MEFFNMLKRLIRPRYWLDPLWGSVGAVALGIVIAGFFLVFKLHPVYCPMEGEKVWPLWQWAYLIVFPFISVVLWLVCTQCYLRSGAKLKIGIVFESSNDNINGWTKTKGILKDLFNDQNIKEKISLRFIPSMSLQEKNKSRKFKKKYGFTLLASVKKDGKDLRANFIIESGPAYDSFMNQTFHGGYNLTSKTKMSDVLDVKTRGLYEILLLTVGTTMYHSKKYEDAAVILRHLDDSIAAKCEHHQSPRQQIRFLDMQCRLVETRFLIKDLPGVFELNRIRQYAETTQVYFDEFPAVAICLARIRFLVGDLDGAVELTEKFCGKIESLLKLNHKIDSSVQAIVFLNYAFLSFIQGHWNSFSGYFKKILDGKLHQKFNWSDLNDFINHVDGAYSFDGIICLRVIYQLLAGKKVDRNLKKEAMQWCQSDTSRTQVRTLINRCSNLPKPKSKPRKPKMAGKKTKRRKR